MMMHQTFDQVHTGRYFVALSLEEAEHVRARLHKTLVRLAGVQPSCPHQYTGIRAHSAKQHFHCTDVTLLCDWRRLKALCRCGDIQLDASDGFLVAPHGQQVLILFQHVSRR